VTPTAGALLAAALGAGCGSFAYTTADLQLDVSDEVPADAETLRVCVSGRGVHSQGVGNGRAAVTGLPAEGAVTVRLELLDADGLRIAEAGPVSLDDDAPWASVPLLPPAEGCDDPGAPAPADGPTRLLGVRFEEGIS
jgi:hypothetical protein